VFTADLILSCEKTTVHCWNPQTSEVIGEVVYHLDLCVLLLKRHLAPICGLGIPSRLVSGVPAIQTFFFASAFFGGTVGIHCIQSTNEPSMSDSPTQAQAQGADIFEVQGFSRASTDDTLSLKQPPKWLRRPASSSFGFGGRLSCICPRSSRNDG
jgi:protein transport protein SEC31